MGSAIYWTSPTLPRPISLYRRMLLHILMPLLGVSVIAATIAFYLAFSLSGSNTYERVQGCSLSGPSSPHGAFRRSSLDPASLRRLGSPPPPPRLKRESPPQTRPNFQKRLVRGFQVCGGDLDAEEHDEKDIPPPSAAPDSQRRSPCASARNSCSPATKRIVASVDQRTIPCGSPK